jgi:hypothetical protein
LKAATTRFFLASSITALYILAENRLVNPMYVFKSYPETKYISGEAKEAKNEKGDSADS